MMNVLSEFFILYCCDFAISPKKNTCWIFDDLQVLKRDYETENVAQQYIGQVGKVTNENVFVTSHLKCLQFAIQIFLEFLLTPNSLLNYAVVLDYKI